MTISVSCPDPDWQDAAQRQGPQRNAAAQFSPREQASGFFWAVAVLAVPSSGVAQRFRLRVEESWDNPSPMEAAVARIRRTDFAFSGEPGAPDCQVRLHKSPTVGVEAALARPRSRLGGGRLLASRWRRLGRVRRRPGRKSGLSLQ